MEGPEILKKDESTWPEKLPKNPTIGDEEREQRKVSSRLQQKKPSLALTSMIVSCKKSFPGFPDYCVLQLG
jgi:hypothetical protein